MIPTVKIDIEADHSCNWRCCWGCKDTDKALKKRDSSGSETKTTTTEKTVTVVRKHLHRKDK